MDFFNYLNYSIGNEDWSVEEKALQVNTHDKVVCVTASGDRPLHLLMTDCAEIISLDMNQIQNHLLELKLAAIKHFDFEKYLAFLGCTPSAHRYAMLNELSPHLSKEGANFWQQNKKMIAKGILYQGRIEKLTYLVAKCFQLLGPNKIKQLFAFDDIHEQKLFVEKQWDTKSWRFIFEKFINPKFFKIVFNDPGFNSYIEYAKNPGKYIYDRMINYLENNLAKHSPLLQLVFNGRLISDAYFPYLTFAGYKKIRENSERLQYKTENIIDYLHSLPENSVDRFSLSDIASYMPQSAFENLLRSVLHAAKPSARFCLREFMSARKIPDELARNFCRDSALEKNLEIAETNFVYRFMVGEVRK